MGLEHDRVRAHTAEAVLRRIDDGTVASLRRHADAGQAAIGARLTVLDREWDIDRTIETEAAAVALTGLALSAFVRLPFLAIPGFVAGALFVHALTGWYPVLPVLRRLGIRTSREIQRERYALKALRGDFAGMDMRADVEAPENTEDGRLSGSAAPRVY